MSYYGADADAAAASATGVVVAVPAAPATAPEAGAVSWMNALTPTISGLIMATVGYGTARTMSVEPRKALGIGVTLGVITAVGQLASNYLLDLAKKAAAPK